MNNINLDNTEIAFQWKSDKEIKQAVFLFKTLSKPFFVKTGKVFTNVANSLHLPIGWAVRRTIYKHFVGGEKLELCNKIVDDFSNYNVKVILDYSVEGGDSEEKINATLDETLKTIGNAAKNPNIPFAVFKPTAFCYPDVMEKASNEDSLNEQEKIEAQKFRTRVKTLCQKAHELNVPIMIDAEDFAFQNFIDRVVFEMMTEFNKEKAIVYNTLQMYRKDRLQFLKDLHQKSVENNLFVGVKFVRGAYMEKERDRATKLGYEDPIHPNKTDTDKAFNDALKFSVEHIDRISIFNATHNEKSSLYLTELMGKHNIRKDDPRCYFSQLFGMSDNISFNLAANGYNVSKYTPYGPIKHVLPYLIRRAEENTSVAGQTSRELSLFAKELKRRKS